MDWQTIPLASIDRVEILRGLRPLSMALMPWQVDQIFTKRVKPVSCRILRLVSATKVPARQMPGCRGGKARGDYAVGVQTERTDGFDAKTTATSNPDKDDHRPHAANAKLGFQLNRDHRLEATALTSQSNSGYDSTLADDRSKRKLETLGLSWLRNGTRSCRAAFP